MQEECWIGVSVGNTRTRVGWFTGGMLEGSAVCLNADPAQITDAITRVMEEKAASMSVMASVNEALASAIRDDAGKRCGITFDRIGEDIPLPLTVSLDRETIVGSDRLLNAIAAFHTIRQACVVIDAGTAVTVDFIDGTGVFHGGAILPGAQMQLDAMHHRTALLPELQFAKPDESAFGRSTGQAMLTGVYHGIRGAVSRLIERYAEHYGAYPTIIATGGDAPLLFDGDPLIDRIVADLPLLGIGITVHTAMRDGAEHDEQDEDAQH